MYIYNEWMNVYYLYKLLINWLTINNQSTYDILYIHDTWYLIKVRDQIVKLIYITVI